MDCWKCGQPQSEAAPEIPFTLTAMSVCQMEYRLEKRNARHAGARCRCSMRKRTNGRLAKHVKVLGRKIAGDAWANASTLLGTLHATSRMAWRNSCWPTKICRQITKFQQSAMIRELTTGTMLYDLNAGIIKILQCRFFGTL